MLQNSMEGYIERRSCWFYPVTDDSVSQLREGAFDSASGGCVLRQTNSATFSSKSSFNVTKVNNKTSTQQLSVGRTSRGCECASADEEVQSFSDTGGERDAGNEGISDDAAVRNPHFECAEEDFHAPQTLTHRHHTSGKRKYIVKPLTVMDRVPPGTKNNFVICFPGDRLSSSLRSNTRYPSIRSTTGSVDSEARVSAAAITAEGRRGGTSGMLSSSGGEERVFEDPYLLTPEERTEIENLLGINIVSSQDFPLPRAGFKTSESTSCPSRRSMPTSPTLQASACKPLGTGINHILDLQDPRVILDILMTAFPYRNSEATFTTPLPQGDSFSSVLPSRGEECQNSTSRTSHNGTSAFFREFKGSNASSPQLSAPVANNILVSSSASAAASSTSRDGSTIPFSNKDAGISKTKTVPVIQSPVSGRESRAITPDKARIRVSVGGSRSIDAAELNGGGDTSSVTYNLEENSERVARNVFQVTSTNHTQISRSSAVVNSIDEPASGFSTNYTINDVLSSEDETSVGGSGTRPPLASATDATPGQSQRKFYERPEVRTTATTGTSEGELWHFLVVLPNRITSVGFSCYDQLFPEGGLTENGNPKNGLYGLELQTLLNQECCNGGDNNLNSVDSVYNSILSAARADPRTGIVQPPWTSSTPTDREESRMSAPEGSIAASTPTQPQRGDEDVPGVTKNFPAPCSASSSTHQEQTPRSAAAPFESNLSFTRGGGKQMYLRPKDNSSPPMSSQSSAARGRTIAVSNFFPTRVDQKPESDIGLTESIIDEDDNASAPVVYTSESDADAVSTPFTRISGADGSRSGDAGTAGSVVSRPVRGASCNSRRPKRLCARDLKVRDSQLASSTPCGDNLFNINAESNGPQSFLASFELNNNASSSIPQPADAQSSRYNASNISVAPINQSTVSFDDPSGVMRRSLLDQTPAVRYITQLCADHLQRYQLLGGSSRPQKRESGEEHLRSPDISILSSLISSIHIVGFSKGCIVLNEIISELAEPGSDDTPMAAHGPIKSFIYGSRTRNRGSYPRSSFACSSASVTPQRTHMPAPTELQPLELPACRVRFVPPTGNVDSDLPSTPAIARVPTPPQPQRFIPVELSSEDSATGRWARGAGASYPVIPLELSFHYVDGGLNTAGAFIGDENSSAGNYEVEQTMLQKNIISKFTTRYLYSFQDFQCDAAAAEEAPAGRVGTSLFCPSRTTRVFFTVYSTPRQRHIYKALKKLQRQRENVSRNYENIRRIFGGDKTIESPPPRLKAINSSHVPSEQYISEIPTQCEAATSQRAGGDGSDADAVSVTSGVRTGLCTDCPDMFQEFNPSKDDRAYIDTERRKLCDSFRNFSVNKAALVADDVTDKYNLQSVVDVLRLHVCDPMGGATTSEDEYTGSSVRARGTTGSTLWNLKEAQTHGTSGDESVSGGFIASAGSRFTTKLTAEENDSTPADKTGDSLRYSHTSVGAEGIAAYEEEASGEALIKRIWAGTKKVNERIGDVVIDTDNEKYYRVLRRRSAACRRAMRAGAFPKSTRPKMAVDDLRITGTSCENSENEDREVSKGGEGMAESTEFFSTPSNSSSSLKSSAFATGVASSESTHPPGDEREAFNINEDQCTHEKCVNAHLSWATTRIATGRVKTGVMGIASETPRATEIVLKVLEDDSRIGNSVSLRDVLTNVAGGTVKSHEGQDDDIDALLDRVGDLDFVNCSDLLKTPGTEEALKMHMMALVRFANKLNSDVRKPKRK